MNNDSVIWTLIEKTCRLIIQYKTDKEGNLTFSLSPGKFIGKITRTCHVPGEIPIKNMISNIYLKDSNEVDILGGVAKGMDSTKCIQLTPKVGESYEHPKVCSKLSFHLEGNNTAFAEGKFIVYFDI